MFDIPDIQPLTDFQRNTREHIRRLEKSGRPGVLTVNGRAKLVVQDVKAWREAAARLEAFEYERAIERGRTDAAAGKGYPAKEVFAELRARAAARRKQKQKK